ncbi:MAG: LytR C-terminal domain-containing protein [Actinomycetota bacterium]|jgi:hypothetical protein|nr:LytR C-terminal domain-containing protein [Actinomycetota bacterium]
MTDSMARSSNGSAVRGVLLVLVAVAVGVLLLRSSDGSSANVSAGETATGGEAITAPGVTQPLPAETTLPAETAPQTTDAANGETTAVAPTESIAVAQTTVPDTIGTTPGFAPRPAAEVTVQVANSTAVKGAAGTASDRFKTLGYIVATPTNLRGTAQPTTKVYYVPGSLLEAQAIAEVLDLDPKNDVFQMFQDTTAIDQWDEPDVLVALGEDLAGG